MRGQSELVKAINEAIERIPAAFPEWHKQGRYGSVEMTAIYSIRVGERIAQATALLRGALSWAEICEHHREKKEDGLKDELRHVTGCEPWMADIRVWAAPEGGKSPPEFELASEPEPDQPKKGRGKSKRG